MLTNTDTFLFCLFGIKFLNLQLNLYSKCCISQIECGVSKLMVTTRRPILLQYEWNRQP